MAVGEVDHARNGFNPDRYPDRFRLRQRFSHWKMGRLCVSMISSPSTRISRSCPGIIYPAWTYNGRIPGPTIRCTEGDLLRITLHQRQRPPPLDALPRHPRRRDGRRARHPRHDRTGRESSPTNSMPNHSGCTCTTATLPRWPGTSPRACTALSSSTRKKAGRRWTTNW